MKIAVVDIETTGLSPTTDSIVEVGVATLDSETGSIVECYHTICRDSKFSEKQKQSWVFQNTSLLFEDVSKAPLFSDILSDLQNVIDKHDATTAYNKQFDFGFLKASGLKIPREYGCPMLAATPICKLPKKGGYGGYKWPKVEEAWKHFFPNEEYVELHRGLDDAMHEAKILYELIKIKVL